MKTRLDAVAIARTFIGTPYVLGARVKGGGLDCGTLLAEYLIEIGATTEAALIAAGFYRAGGAGHAFSHDWFCHARREEYLRALMLFGKLVAETVCRPGIAPQPGDLVLFRCVRSKLFNHGAIVTSWPHGVHACDGKVRESNLVTHRLTGYKQMDIFDPFPEQPITV